MPGFVDSGIRYVRIRKIDHGISLEVVGIDQLTVESQGSPAEFSIFIVKEAVDWAAIDQTGVGIQFALSEK